MYVWCPHVLVPIDWWTIGGRRLDQFVAIRGNQSIIRRIEASAASMTTHDAHQSIALGPELLFDVNTTLGGPFIGMFCKS